MFIADTPVVPAPPASADAPAAFRAQTQGVIATTPVPLCAVCGGETHTAFAHGYDYEIQTCANRWAFVQCTGCGHVWLTPRPAVETLGVIYPKTYYAYNYEKQISPLAVKGKAFLDRSKMKGILKRLAGPPKRFVDIGCGDGRFLRVMEKTGLRRGDLYGLELDENVVRPLQAAGYQAFQERVETCDKIPAGSIDLATMFHVIEHVDAPDAVVRKVVEWLAPGGCFAIETPNTESLDARWFKEKYWGGYHFPRHWHLFSPGTLRKLLEDNGLKVIAIKYQTGHSFWMHSFHHALKYGKKPKPGRLARLFWPLTSLPFLIMFTLLDKCRAAVGIKTSAMLLIAQKPG